MRKFKVYRRQWGSSSSRMMYDFATGKMVQTIAFRVDMVPIMTINAYSPEHALRIAKQKGVTLPIIGEANDTMAP